MATKRVIWLTEVLYVTVWFSTWYRVGLVSVFVFRSAIPAILLRTETRRERRGEELYSYEGKKLGSYGPRVLVWCGRFELRSILVCMSKMIVVVMSGEMREAWLYAWLLTWRGKREVLLNVKLVINNRRCRLTMYCFLWFGVSFICQDTHTQVWPFVLKPLLCPSIAQVS